MYASLRVAFIYQIEACKDNVVRLAITCQQGGNEPSVTTGSEAPDGADGDATEHNKAAIAYVNAKSSATAMLEKWDRAWKTNQPCWLVIVGEGASADGLAGRAFMVCGSSELAGAVDTFLGQLLLGQPAELEIETGPAEILALEPDPRCPKTPHAVPDSSIE